MNSFTKALKRKVGRVIDTGSNLIANRAMLRPSMDKARGEMADKKRTMITRNRESRANDKAMGY